MIQTEGDAYSLKMPLPPDTYRVLVFNCDVEDVRFLSMNKFEAAEASIVSASNQDELRLPNAPLYIAYVEKLTIRPGQTFEQTVAFKPFVQQILLTVNMENCNSICTCTATLSGIAASMNLSKRNQGVSPLASFPFQMDRTKTGFSKSLLLLDLPGNFASDTPSNTLQLHFDLTDTLSATSTINLGNMLMKYGNQSLLIEVNASIIRSSSPSVELHNWNVKPVDGEVLSNLL